VLRQRFFYRVEVYMDRYTGARGTGTRAIAAHAAFFGVFLGVNVASAATLMVTSFLDNTTDNDVCTLREAVRAANLSPANSDCGTAGSGSNTIVLKEGTYLLTGSTLDVSRTMTIRGVSSSLSNIRADLSATKAIRIIGSGNLTFEDTSLAKGTQSAGITGLYLDGLTTTLTLNRARVLRFTLSGIINRLGSLNVNDSTIADNTSFLDGAGIRVEWEGDSQVSAQLRIKRSLIEGNSALGATHGGGLYFSAGSTSTSEVTNSTFSGNYATSRGGAIFASADSYLNLNHVTATLNEAGLSGGGVTDATVGACVRCVGCIWSDNFAQSGMDVEGPFPSSYSVMTTVDELYTGNYWDAPNRIENPRLGALLDMGGFTQVHPLLFQAPPLPSPAIDFGDPAIISGEDQRGLPRPKGSAVDVGAFEFDPAFILMQSEVHPVAAKSATPSGGDVYSVVTNASYSGGRGVNVAFDAINDFITFPIGVPVGGNYNVRVRVKRGSNEGTFQLARANSLGGTYTNIGSAQNLYQSSSSWTELNIGNFALTEGQRYLRFRVTGKSSSSVGYQLYIDYIKLTKV
jgi:CSLREA domain-containing protein